MLRRIGCCSGARGAVASKEVVEEGLKIVAVEKMIQIGLRVGVHRVTLAASLRRRLLRFRIDNVATLMYNAIRVSVAEACGDLYALITKQRLAL